MEQVLDEQMPMQNLEVLVPFALMPLQHSENIQDLDVLLDYLGRQPGDQFNQFIDYLLSHSSLYSIHVFDVFGNFVVTQPH